MDERTFNLVCIIFGSVLTLLLTVLPQWWSSRQKLRAVKTAVFMELEEVARRLAFCVFRVESRRGRFDREALTWLRSQLAVYRGLGQRTLLPEVVVKLLALPDSDLDGMAAQYAATTGDTSFVREEAPYSASAVPLANEFEAQFAARLMDILAHLRMFEDCRQNGAYFLRLTFDGTISVENHRRAQVNLNAFDAKLSQLARTTAEKIVALRREFDPRLIKSPSASRVMSGVATNLG
jgi:hypothetical protein